MLAGYKGFRIWNSVIEAENEDDATGGPGSRMTAQGRCC
jgi:hypothetical protein